MPQKSKFALISMPFADTSIPSIQLSLLQSYLEQRNIKIDTYHFYIFAADIYGLQNYNYLINPPNDSYIAQMAFSKTLFPKHFKKNINKFRYFYEKIISKSTEFQKNLNFEKYIKKTEEFIFYLLKNNWEKYELIGFTLNYGQLLPSLLMAKKIREKNPEIKILFGGSTTIGELGKRLLRTFNWIDFIISGEGEESLYLLLCDQDDPKLIPGLIYKEGKCIKWNKNESYLDLNKLPYPNYDSYLNNLENISSEIKQYYTLYGRIPIELSRGCWWNRCNFCNIQAYNKKYREKKTERFIEEINYLSDKYKNLRFHIIANTIPQVDYKSFCKKIIEQKKNFSFYIEARSGQLKSKDYELLKRAGFKTIQTGIESFSKNLLGKMNKGTKVIHNIAALKYCRENHIKNYYNIIIDYPTEEDIDYMETQTNIQLFRQYLEPPKISRFLVGFNSPIYKDIGKFNIKNIEYKIIDKIIYPKNILENNFQFFYDFNTIKKYKENNWGKLVSNWKTEYEKRAIDGIKRETDISKLIFYYEDGKNFLKIYDYRDNSNVFIYTLNKKERKIFLDCNDVTSIEELKQKNLELNENELLKILNDFIQIGIIFKEDDLLLSLPLNYHENLTEQDQKNKTGKLILEINKT